MNKFYYKRDGNTNVSPSKRWQTTTQSSLEDVASKLAGNYDRAGLLKGLEDRKMKNNKTSINFGNEIVNYTSDAKEQQSRGVGGNSVEERMAQAARIKKMKADLTVTNFKLGDEIPTYQSVNQLAMKAAEGFPNEPKVQLNTDLKETVKKSSIHFGNESVDYSTVQQSSMQYLGNQNNFAKLKDEVKQMTATLRKHNFSFGDEKVSYQTDYNAGYSSVPMDAYRIGDRKKGMRAIIDDSRACHFSLGQDKVNYKSNAQQSMSSIDGFTATDASKSVEHAKAMKVALQKTSIVIGDDKEYY
eukprot:gene13503-18117_t